MADLDKMAAGLPEGAKGLLLAAKPHPNAPSLGLQVDRNAAPASLRSLRARWLIRPRPSKALTALGVQLHCHMISEGKR